MGILTQGVMVFGNIVAKITGMSANLIFWIVVGGLFFLVLLILWLKPDPPHKNEPRPYECWGRAHEGSCNCTPDCETSSRRQE